MRRLACVLLSFWSVAAAAAGVRLTIALEPATELPAIPVTLRVQLSNLTEQPVTVINTIALRVAPAEGASFFAVAGPRAGGVTVFPNPRRQIILAAGETRDLTLWAALDSPFFGWDRRLWKPGRFRLQLLIDSELSKLSDADVTDLTAELPLTDPIVSNEVVFTVSEPTGADAVVYEWIRSAGGSWSAALARRIWTEDPSSGYAPWAVPHSDDPVARIAAYEAAIAKAPSSVISELWRLNASHLALLYVPRVTTEAQIDAVVDVMQREEAALTHLAANARDPRVRADARELLKTRIRTREEILYYLRRDRGEITSIEPHIVCVSPAGKKGFVAWLTYYNPSRKLKVIPVGELNKFTPVPFNRLQPTEFRINFPTEWFKVVAESAALTWHIDGTNFRIEPSVAPRPCPADMDEHHDEYFRGVRQWPEE